MVHVCLSPQVRLLWTSSINYQSQVLSLREDACLIVGFHFCASGFRLSIPWCAAEVAAIKEFELTEMNRNALKTVGGLYRLNS